MAAFKRAAARIEGIVSCALVSGKQDYHEQIVCGDLDHYERLHRQHLGRLPDVNTISSSFVLRQVATRAETEAFFGSDA